MALTHQTCLIVEDNPDFNHVLSRALKKVYRVDQVTTLAGAFRHIAEKDLGYDLVLLDRTLPDGDGLDLLKLLQTEFPRTRVCVVSAVTPEQERISGLQQGADAYLCKPLTTRYILEQLKALLRIGSTARLRTQKWQDLVFDPTTNVVRRQKNEVRLTRREAQCLRVFFESQEGRVTRQDLLRVFWSPEKFEYNSVLHVNVQRLRLKLQQLGLSIQVHYGSGYQLVYQNI